MLCVQNVFRLYAIIVTALSSLRVRFMGNILVDTNRMK